LNKTARLLTWPFGALLLVALALIIFAAPATIEGPMLLFISPGHALSVLDSIALVPLLAGTAWLHFGFWKRRKQIYETLRASPAKSSIVLFIAGLGLGLLIASAFSAFFWWWAIGAILFAGCVVIAVFAARKEQ